MKILLTVHQFVPDWSAGTEVLTFSVAKELLSRGHNVVVFTGFPSVQNPTDAEQLDCYEIEGILVYRYHHARLPSAEQAAVTEIEYDNHTATRLFRDIVQQIQPDIIHFFHFARLGAGLIDVAIQQDILTYFTPTDFWTICPTAQLLLTDSTMCKGPSFAGGNCVKHIAILTRGAKAEKYMPMIPTPVADGMAILAKNFFGNFHPLALEVGAMVNRRSLNVARINKLQAIFSPTKLMTDSLTNNGVRANLIRSSAFGIDVSGYEHTKVRTDVAHTIGFIGTLSSYKGCHILIQAFNQLNLPSLKLKIYGNPEHFPNYSTDLHSLAADNEAIEFCGTFPNHQIADVLSELDVLVVPSLWYENTPLVVYSALAAHCPVIASDFPGMSEVVVHEENGLVFPAGDSYALAEQLRMLANTPDLLPRLSLGCKPPKSSSEYVDELESTYQTDLSSQKSRSLAIDL
jgi:glycosyltransferase involved in cell wall biosynthesis